MEHSQLEAETVTGRTPSQLAALQHPRSGRRRRQRRIPLNCRPCRVSKLRCNRQHPCGTCQRRDCVASCTYQNANTTTNVAVTLADLPAPDSSGRSITSDPFASTQTTGRDLDLPGPEHESPESTQGRWDAVLRRPTVDYHDPLTAPENLFMPFSLTSHVSMKELLEMLPSTDCCDYLISHYFAHLSPMFPILHDPTFQKEYSAFVQEPDKVHLSFLALIFMMCSMSLNTMESDDTIVAGLLSQSQDHLTYSLQLRNAAMTCLCQDHFLVHHNLHILQTLLLLIYTICHNEGVERAWSLLGMGLNIAMALRCHVLSNDLSHLEIERRRRCWCGILTLHTYQAILFRDIDMSFPLNIKATMSAEINDVDIHDAPSQKRSLSLMKFKIRFFQLSTQICGHISGPSTFDEVSLHHFNQAIAEEQHLWDSTFLIDGSPSVLDSASYAHWCILQTYAHQLYLVLHRPFHHSQSPRFLPASREKCIESSTALLDIHRLLCELPRFRYYKWIVNGMTSFNALHGAVALASCLLDTSDSLDMRPYWAAFDATVHRMEALQNRSPVCAKAYPILRHLQ